LTLAPRIVRREERLSTSEYRHASTTIPAVFIDRFTRIRRRLLVEKVKKKTEGKIYNMWRLNNIQSTAKGMLSDPDVISVGVQSTVLCRAATVSRRVF